MTEFGQTGLFNVGAILVHLEFWAILKYQKYPSDKMIDLQLLLCNHFKKGSLIWKQHLVLAAICSQHAIAGKLGVQ